MLEYTAIRKELEHSVKSAPFLNTERDWCQNGWVLSTDGGLHSIVAPLVSVQLFDVWTKVVQTRANGWVGENFHVGVMFDETKSVNDVVRFLDAQFRAAISARLACRRPNDVSEP